MDMQVTLQEAKLLRRDTIAEGTMAFHLEKPSGFSFKAGQAIDIDIAGERHAFSIVSAPGEGDLVFATRMRQSTYKRALAALDPGTSVGIDGPFGGLTLHKDRRRAAVFIAGGIGITPFMSMLRQAARDDDDRSLTLIYSNRRPEDAAYLSELQRLARTTTGFRFIATMTKMSASSLPWEGETRMIDATLLESATRGLKDPVFYVVGPPAMVAAVRKLLQANSIDDEDVRTEEFFGY